MSERADMKRRVKGLLHKNWLKPLGALALAVLPVTAVALVAVWLLRPDAGQIASQLSSLTIQTGEGGLMATAMMFMAALIKPLDVVRPLVGWLPLGAVLGGLYLLIFLPVTVSTYGYFMGFLRGKEPKALDVYGCFSAKYPRILGGMAYMVLWQALWFIASFIVPCTLILSSAVFVSALGIEFNPQLILFVIIVGVSIVWLIVFFFVFINRMLAYALAPACLAAQPKLPAARAVRLSRKLMRGCKWQFIGLLLSFLNYFIPAIIAALALPVLALYGSRMGIDGILLQSIRTFLWVVVFANQIEWAYVGPYMAASIGAFYIERKREALLDQDVTPEDFSARSKEDGVDEAGVKASRKGKQA